MKKYLLLFLTLSLMCSCGTKDEQFDASGSFEAEETIVSAEAGGVLKVFALQEGQSLAAGQYIGYIDSTQAQLRKQQLQAQKSAVQSRKPDVAAQLASLETQLAAAAREERRTAKLVSEDAATRKQLDDATTQVKVIKKQIEAQRSSLSISTGSVNAESAPYDAQLAQAADQLAKYRLYAPVAGTVLAKYAKEGELALAGKPLYKIAALDTLWLRAYVTADQLSQIALGSSVTVLVDDGPKKYKRCKGVVTWISEKTEFTPKAIQTKDERANTVYAMKIRVPNDGALKIGMYAEVRFANK